MEGVDYSFTPPTPVGLKAAGKKFALVYIGPGSGGKQLDATERDALWSNDIAIGLLAEGTESSALGGYDVGVSHAKLVMQDLTALGVPASIPVYFAVDFNATAAQWPAVARYFDGIASVIGRKRTGIYGGLKQIQWAVRDGVAPWLFQTYGWSLVDGVTVWDPHAQIQQYKNNVALAGGTVDLCRSMVDNFGQWTRQGVIVTQPTFVELGKQYDGSYLIKRVEALLRMDPSYTVVSPNGATHTEANALAVAIKGIQDALKGGATVPGLSEEDIRKIIRDELDKTKLSS